METEVENGHPGRAGPDLEYLLSTASVAWQQQALEAGYVWVQLDEDLAQKIELYFGEDVLEARNQIDECEIELNRLMYLAEAAQKDGNNSEEVRRTSMASALLEELQKDWTEHLAKKRRARFKVYRTNAAFTVLGAITGALAGSMISPQTISEAAGWVSTVADKIM